jgi:hypothetical protein
MVEDFRLSHYPGSEGVVGGAVIRLFLRAAWTKLFRSPARRVFPGIQL